MLQEFAVFFEGTGDEDIFQGLPFFCNLQFGIAALFLEMVIDFNIPAIETGMMGDDFFAEDENASRTKISKNSAEKSLSIQRTDKLEGVIEEKGRGLGLVHFCDICIDKVETLLPGKEFCFKSGLVEHGRGVVYPQVIEVFVFQQAAELQKRCAGGTAEVDDIRTFLQQAAQDPGDGADYFLVMGDGAVEHVVEDLSNAIIKDEVSTDSLHLKKRIPVVGRVLLRGGIFCGLFHGLIDVSGKLMSTLYTIVGAVRKGQSRDYLWGQAQKYHFMQIIP